MVWKHLKKADYAVSAWSGGSTTQLLIAPESARYADRDFLWRVSSATVELEESDFTPLPDYERLIATLEGEIVLRHNGGPPLRLRPYEVHAFSGADATHASGRCRDFNLMLRRGAAEGEMLPLPLQGETPLPPDPRAEARLLYCVCGGCAVTEGAARVQLAPGESLLLGPEAALRLAPTLPDTRLMLCRMRRCKAEGKDARSA